MYLFKLMKNAVLFALIILSGFSAAQGAGKVHTPNLSLDLKPGLGRQLVKTTAIVSPDGTGLPDGRGSVVEGKSQYDAKCAACHGVDGQQAGNQLAGGIGSIDTAAPLKTVGSYWPYATTLYDYIARAMPYNEQKSLSADEVYAITAYVLRLNDILDDDAILDKDNLAEITMPNRAGFVELIR